MQQEIRFATFNVRNLALPGAKYYENLAPYTQQQYKAKTDWIAHQIDQTNADVIGFQEIFSQAALKHVLSKTRHYKNAHHAGFDPDPNRRIKMTPSVALVSRLPFAGAAISHLELPHQLQLTLPTNSRLVHQFSRAILEVPLALPGGKTAHVLVVHLKSKKPDYILDADRSSLYEFGVASLRALIRRGSDALGLRFLVADMRRAHGKPLIVMGDFNDIATASSTQIVTGEGFPDEHGRCYHLYDCAEIQSGGNSLRDVAYTDIYRRKFFTIDHILVTEEFSKATDYSIGQVRDVLYFNDHVMQNLPHTTDHGLVMARIRLRGGGSENPDSGSVGS